MATYIDMYNMWDNVDFQKQVSVACRLAAYDILNEDPQTTNHDNRVDWAMSVLGGMGISNNAVTRMISAAIGNATLAAASPDGPWVDGDIQFVVNSLIDTQASNA